jgi:hypothetical protein
MRENSENDTRGKEMKRMKAWCPVIIAVANEF